MEMQLCSFVEVSRVSILMKRAIRYLYLIVLNILSIFMTVRVQDGLATHKVKSENQILLFRNRSQFERIFLTGYHCSKTRKGFSSSSFRSQPLVYDRSSESNSAIVYDGCKSLVTLWLNLDLSGIA